ncbi:hypothetical protein [Haloplanus pelagicus]|jgi:hypothetical protein|uniref:hypothetical protein n=1 Tax=Haloplanus pelagicus TaxID=2949995 RepID=UPI00204110AA|nr:hypothetical protein [Haloplanus sp. HW8-1]
MPNNVANTAEITRNLAYRTLIWVGAWLRAFESVLLVPLLVVVVWYLVIGAASLFGARVTRGFVEAVVVGIAVDLLKLGVFSTLLVLFVKASVRLKVELETVWNVLVPRYEGHAGMERTYDERSLFTEGYLPESKIRDAELEIMAARSRALFGYSLVAYAAVKVAVSAIGEAAVVAHVGTVFERSTSSQLLFALVGVPILFANMVHELRFSVYLSPDVAVFLVAIGIPSVPFVLGLRNRISYYRYRRVNRVLHCGASVLLAECRRAALLGSKLLLGMLLLLLGSLSVVALAHAAEFLFR